VDLDLAFSPAGFSAGFQSLREGATTRTIDGLTVLVASLDDVIASKEACVVAPRYRSTPARSTTPTARRKRPATWKKSFGHHPLLVFRDRPEIAGGEVLAGILRALTAPYHQGAGLARRRDRHGLQAD
jgi:hypothetical protein